MLQEDTRKGTVRYSRNQGHLFLRQEECITAEIPEQASQPRRLSRWTFWIQVCYCSVTGGPDNQVHFERVPGCPISVWRSSLMSVLLPQGCPELGYAKESAVSSTCLMRFIRDRTQVWQRGFTQLAPAPACGFIIDTSTTHPKDPVYTFVHKSIPLNQDVLGETQDFHSLAYLSQNTSSVFGYHHKIYFLLFLFNERHMPCGTASACCWLCGPE